MVPLQMELGGKDVCIVCSDAKLELVAKHIAKGGFSYSGQRCTAVKLVMVEKSVRRGQGGLGRKGGDGGKEGGQERGMRKGGEDSVFLSHPHDSGPSSLCTFLITHPTPLHPALSRLRTMWSS
jgi:hypothetical protein